VTRVDNTAHLRRAAAARHDDAVDRSREAIRTASRLGHPVSFAAIATAAAVSRSWLYAQPDLRTAITDLRHRPATGRPIARTERATDDSLHQRLDAARIEITRLRADNATLRDQLERSLGAQRLRR